MVADGISNSGLSRSHEECRRGRSPGFSLVLSAHDVIRVPENARQIREAEIASLPLYRYFYTHDDFPRTRNFLERKREFSERGSSKFLPIFGIDRKFSGNFNYSWK